MLKQLLLGTAALTSLALAAADDANLAKNPGFEEKGGWVIWGTGSDLTNDDRKEVMIIDESTAAAGAKSLKVTDKAPKSSPYVIQFIPTPTPAKSYRLTFKAKTAEDGANFRAGAMFNKGEKHDYLGAKIDDLRGTTDWKEYTVNITNIKPGTDHLALVLGPAKYGQDNTGTAWFDDVVLIPVNE